MSNRSNDDPPPVFRTWGRLYAAVLIFLLLIIVALYLFSERFNEVPA